MKQSRKLNILLISKTLPWQFKGGIQTHVWNLAESLVGKGHAVSILNGGPFRSKTNKTKKDNIQIIQIPYFPGRYIKPIALLAEELAFNWVVLKWVKKNHKGFDIIHTQGRSGYLLSFFASIRQRLVNTVHGLIDIENSTAKDFNLNNQLHHLFTKKVERRLQNSASGLVAVSQTLSTEMNANRGIHKQIHVIPNGIHPQSSNPTRESKTAKFLFVGRLHPIKGLAKVLEQMDQSKDNIYLDIIGNGSEKAHLESIIEQKGLAKRVRLLGEFSNNEVNNVLPYYTALLLPSEYETQGIVLLEANAQAIPVIASDLPAIRESIINGENGILCPPDQPLAFIEAMNYMAHNRGLARQMGLKGKAIVESKFSWSAIADQTESLYYSLAV